MPNKSPQIEDSEECAFCKIAKGETSSFSVFRDSTCFAFLDRRPLFEGHCLLIPIRHFETLLDLPEDLVGPLFTNAKHLAEAVQTATKADGTFVAINNRISQSIPHLHIHIVPRRQGDGLRGFFWPRRTYANEHDVIAIQDAILSAMSSQNK
jgi:histidine triad (HIT) family protein